MKKFKIVNKTPHDVNIVNEKGEIIKTYPKTDTLIRLKQKTQPAKERFHWCEPEDRVDSLDYRIRNLEIDGVPITETVFGEPEGLPEPKDDVYYIVSQLVKSSLPERDDLLVPAEIVRDENGNIIGCRSLGI